MPNQQPELYRLPRKPGYLGGYNWRATIFGLLLLLIVNFIATQYIAARFQYQPVLGQPVLRTKTGAIYQPFYWVVWGWQYSTAKDERIRRPFFEGEMIVLAGSFLSVGIFFVIANRRARRLSENAEDLHGSARWAGEDDVRETGLLDTRRGVYVGGWRPDGDRRLRYLRHNGPEHILAFAPTRSGKGVGLVIPSLLAWDESAVIYDIKGENWHLTAGFRSRHGRVLLFDPTNPKSSAYNPLLEVRRGEWEVRDVQNVADVLVDPEGSLDKRNHWEKTSHSLLVGTILHVLYAEADKTLAGVANFLSDPRRPIETTLRAMMTTPHLGEAGVHPVVASSARELLNKSDNERSGVLSTAMSFLGLYRDPVVATVTRRCDWRIHDLLEGKTATTLHLVVPPSDISRTKPPVRLILNQIGRRGSWTPGAVVTGCC